MQELLRNPLPTLSGTGTWKSNVIDPAPHQRTHPTEVKEWPGWEAEVKALVWGLPSVRNLQNLQRCPLVHMTGRACAAFAAHHQANQIP